MAVYPGTRIGTPRGRSTFTSAPPAESAFDFAAHTGQNVLIRPLSFALRTVDGSTRPHRVVLADVCVLTGEDEGIVYCDVPVTAPGLLNSLESVLADPATELLAGTLVCNEKNSRWKLEALNPEAAAQAWSTALSMDWNEGFGLDHAAARLAENLRRERQARDVRQADLGAPVGLDQSQVSHIEGSRRGVSAVEAREFAKTLGMDLSSLLP